LPSPPRPFHLTAILIAALALIAAACGSSSSDTASGVASLEDVAAAEEESATGDSTDTQAAGDGTLEADEAALQFSQCMRDEGLDFPDIGVDAEGNPDIRDAFQNSGTQPGSPEFREAMDTCGELLDGVSFGGRRAGLADNTELQDALIAYSDCLRDEGLDVGDFQLGAGQARAQDGAAQDGAGDTPQRGQGRRQGGFGDPNARIAQALDLDPEDPEVAAALDTCAPVLETALSQFGPGAQTN
jgi:hypothetical protein